MTDSDGSSNLPRATKLASRMVLNVLIGLHLRGYADSTLKGIRKKLRQLGRHADLEDPVSVLRYIHGRKSVNTKSLFANAYNHYAEYYKIEWLKPVFRRCEVPVKVPLEENLDYIIRTSKSLKRRVAFAILKDSGIRPIELHNLTLQDIDLEQGIIYVRSAKHGTPRSLKLKT